MKTVRQKLEQMLFEMGMFESQTVKVIDLAIPEIDAMQPSIQEGEADEQPEPYKVKWSNPSTDYPDAIYSIWFQKVKQVALQWIDKECPQAWFRELFESKTSAV